MITRQLIVKKIPIDNDINSQKKKYNFYGLPSKVVPTKWPKLLLPSIVYIIASYFGQKGDTFLVHIHACKTHFDLLKKWMTKDIFCALWPFSKSSCIEIWIFEQWKKYILAATHNLHWNVFARGGVSYDLEVWALVLKSTLDSPLNAFARTLIPTSSIPSSSTQLTQYQLAQRHCVFGYPKAQHYCLSRFCFEMTCQVTKTRCQLSWKRCT
jgi:hypothetical protein